MSIRDGHISKMGSEVLESPQETLGVNSRVEV